MAHRRTSFNAVAPTTSLPTATFMRINRTWNVKCPAPTKKVIAGAFVPIPRAVITGSLGLTKQKRIAIEIHGPDEDESQDFNDSFLSDSTRNRHSTSRGGNTPTGTRISNRISDLGRLRFRPPNLGVPGRGLIRNFGAGNAGGGEDTFGSRRVMDLSKELQEDDRVVIRILKPRRTWGFDFEDDSSSSSDDSLPNLEDDPIAKLEIEDGWMEHRKYGLDDIQDDELHPNKSSWEATMGLDERRERREFVFETAEQAKDFATELQKLRSLVKERAAIRLAAYQQEHGGIGDSVPSTMTMPDGSIVTSRDSSLELEGDESVPRVISPKSEISLLIEIVSATDLPIADLNSTDPYVVVFLGNKKIHRTDYISTNLNPIWGVDTGSLFIVSQSAEDYFAAGYGLTFVVKDYDTVSSSESICQVSVSAADLLKQTGERISFDLEHLDGRLSTQHFNPKLNLRIRKATQQDKDFMKKLHAVRKNSKKNRAAGVYAEAAFIAPKPERVSPFKKEKKIERGVKMYRVKPRPDPTRSEGVTKWMTAEELDEEAMKPTYEWIEAGTGTLGKLYVEVIRCDNLPNMDSKLEGLSDAFCCMIFEDAIVNTDVINDELSPRWMPWSRRGFVFNIAHPSSQLLLGVLDYDQDTALYSHDAIGRITVDVTNFHADTEYLLTYDLYRSVLDDDRETFGTITIRLRLEYDSYRDFVLGSLKFPNLNYINLAKRNDFLASFFVCHGEENLQKIDFGAITAYRNELTGYVDVFYHMGQAIITVMLWRGHFRFYGTKLPLHSMVAFLMGIFVVENFNLIPSFGCFSIAWLLLATNEHRQRNPSPWHETMTFQEMWHAVLIDKAPPIEIADHENEAAIRRFERTSNIRRAEEMKSAREAAEQARKISSFLRAESSAAAETVETDLSTKKGTNFFPIASLILLPIQRMLGQTCKILRIGSSIVLWDESIYAFLLVNICLALGLIFLFVPWSYFIRWTTRTLVWLLLGPWMKLVDVLYVQKLATGEVSDAEAFRKLAEIKTQQVAMARESIMLQKEEIVKTRAMKMYMFGKFTTRIPQFKEYRFPDIPRHESSATPIKASNEAPNAVKIYKKSHGQTIVGDMIPTWGDAVDAVTVKQDVSA